MSPTDVRVAAINAALSLAQWKEGGKSGTWSEPGRVRQSARCLIAASSSGRLVTPLDRYGAVRCLQLFHIVCTINRAMLTL